MANLVIASNSKSMSKLDGSIKNKVYDFFEKLSESDTSNALHIEPLNAAVDPRVRTGRVDYHYRAVLFKVDDKSAGPTYIYMGTWPHDEANKLAERAILRVNPINGTLGGLDRRSAGADVCDREVTCTQRSAVSPTFLSGRGRLQARGPNRGTGLERRRRRASNGCARRVGLNRRSRRRVGLGGQRAARPSDRHRDRRQSAKSTALQVNPSIPHSTRTSRSSKPSTGQHQRCSSRYIEDDD